MVSWQIIYKKGYSYVIVSSVCTFQLGMLCKFHICTCFMHGGKKKLEEPISLETPKVSLSYLYL